jgi:alpha-glucosidase (family GH31 glycosyl hydrolase)
MFGDDILVSPVVTAAENEGMAYHQTWLPEGQWFDVCRGTLVPGSQTLSDWYGQEEIPYFYRAGAIVPCNPLVDNLKTRPTELHLLVVPGADGETSLYEDENDTEGYKQGAYTTTRISHQGSQLIIHPREGRFPGMPGSRSYTVEFLAQQRPSAVLVNGNQIGSDAWSYDQTKRVVTVNISRTSCQQEISIKLKG